MSHNLNYVKGGYIRDYIGDYYRAYRASYGNTRGLDYGSNQTVA